MPPHTGDGREIVRHLEEINTQLTKQNSFSHMFVVGIFYGIGFFVGSAIIATIALGVVAPVFANIPWIHDTFLTGLSLLHH